MGRELKRVPMDFDWPIGMTWKGYVYPFNAPVCEACEGQGYNKETLNLHKTFSEWCNSLTTNEIEKLWEGTHKDRSLEEFKQEVKSGRVDLDLFYKYPCVKIRAELKGVYGNCKYCNGEGQLWASEKIKKQADRWKRIEPPKGDGYQLWQNTSEGSPVSPVFASLEELCKWCAGNATTFGSFRGSAQEWYDMLSDGFVSHKRENLLFC